LYRFSSVLDNHAPLKRKRVKKATQPNWFNSDILRAFQQRNHFHKSKDNINYRLWRQKVKSLICYAKTNYYNEHIISKQHNHRQLWNSLKELSGQSSTSAHTSLKYDEGDMIKNPLTVANLFNEHVFNVCKSVELNTNAMFDSTQLKDVTNRKLYNVDQFYIPPLTIVFVEKELNTLNTTKATGADNTHAKFLKMSSSTIAPLLTYIFDYSVK